jgi:hypothetical protein
LSDSVLKTTESLNISKGAFNTHRNAYSDVEPWVGEGNESQRNHIKFGKGKRVGMKPHGEVGEDGLDRCLEKAELGHGADNKTCYDVTLASLNDLDTEWGLEGWLEVPVIEFNDSASMVSKLDIVNFLLSRVCRCQTTPLGR